MEARITRSFRIAENGGTRKYTAGDVAQGETAVWAIDNGYGKKVVTKNKASAPENKTRKS